MKKLQGDLLSYALNDVFDVIVHGCNCQCNMGAGIAKSIKIQFPEAYAADCETAAGDAEKLGNYTTARIERDGNIRFTIVNAYTQFQWKGKGIKVDYDAVRSVFQKIKQDFTGLRIGYPLIGAGLAGGDWSVISAIIDEELYDEDHTLVEFVPPTNPRRPEHKRLATDSEKSGIKKSKKT